MQCLAMYYEIIAAVKSEPAGENFAMGKELSEMAPEEFKTVFRELHER